MSASETPPAKASARDARPRPRIERAYCIELGRVVGIDEARRIVLEEGRSEGFHFECAEAPCAHRAVRIAGVNYRFDAELKPKLISNHFRRLDDHDAACPYFAAEDVVPDHDAGAGARRSRALRRDLIEEFVPPRLQLAGAAERPGDPTEPASEDQAPRRRARRARFAATSSLARLVDSYRALVASGVPNAVRDHTIHVRGIGRISLAEYVTPVYRANRLAHTHVIYGGARLYKSYGRGFKLRFIDRIHGKPVFIYAAGSLAADREPWKAELTPLREGRYCTAYVLGSIEARPNQHSMSIEISSPEHLVLCAPQSRSETEFQ
jgi:hypothetical protein